MQRMGKVYTAMRWELLRLLDPATRFTRVYFAAPDERGAAYQMSTFYQAVNDVRGWK